MTTLTLAKQILLVGVACGLVSPLLGTFKSLYNDNASIVLALGVGQIMLAGATTFAIIYGWCLLFAARKDRERRRGSFLSRFRWGKRKP